jgi:hypothetical protein
LSSSGKPGIAGSPSPMWRNWQTHQLEGLAGEILWEFESPHRHWAHPKSIAAGPAQPPSTPGLMPLMQL